MGEKCQNVENKVTPCNFKSDEYHRVNDELLERMRGIFTHGFSLITMVGLLWTITATLMSNFDFARLLGEKSQTFLFAGLIIFLLGTPVVILYPFSVKYRDNLRVISNLGAYTKVFFEYPFLLKKIETKTETQSPMMAWETLHCGAKYGIKKMFGFEYLAAAIISDILVIISCSYFLSIKWNTYFFIFSIIYFVLLVFITIIIALNSRTTHPLESYGKEYFLVYLAEAVRWGFLSEKEAEFCKNHQIDEIRRDIMVSKKLKNKKFKSRDKFQKTQEEFDCKFQFYMKNISDI